MDDADVRTERWDAVSFVVRSQYRTLVLDQLATGPEIPSRIDADEQVLLEHVSRAIRELRARNLVELRVPEDQKKHRLYGLTDRGEQIWQRMQRAGFT